MKYFKILLIPSLVFAAIACTSKPAELPVQIQVNHAVDFRTLKTFRPATYPGPNAAAFPELQKLAKEAVIKEMVKRGYTRIQDGSPDFRLRTYLHFNSYLGQELGASKTTGEMTLKAKDLRDVTLLIEIVGTRNETTYWSGRVYGFKLDPIQAKTTLEGAAWRLLAEFPPLF